MRGSSGDERMRANVLIDALVDGGDGSQLGGSTPPAPSYHLRGSARRMRRGKRGDVQRAGVIDQRARIAAMGIDHLTDAGTDACISDGEAGVIGRRISVGVDVERARIGDVRGR